MSGRAAMFTAHTAMAEMRGAESRREDGEEEKDGEEGPDRRWAFVKVWRRDEGGRLKMRSKSRCRVGGSRNRSRSYSRAAPLYRQPTAKNLAGGLAALSSCASDAAQSGIGMTEVVDRTAPGVALMLSPPAPIVERLAPLGGLARPSSCS